MGDDGFFAQTGMPFSDEYSPSAPRGILVGTVPQIVKAGEGENPPHTKLYLPQLAALSLLTS